MLSDMAGRGNVMARLRQKELTLLQEMKEAAIRRETERTDQSDLAPELSSTIHIFPPFESTGEWIWSTQDISVDHTQILNLAQQLDIISGSDWDINFGIGGDSWI